MIPLVCHTGPGSRMPMPDMKYSCDTQQHPAETCRSASMSPHVPNTASMEITYKGLLGITAGRPLRRRANSKRLHENNKIFLFLTGQLQALNNIKKLNHVSEGKQSAVMQIWR